MSTPPATTDSDTWVAGQSALTQWFSSAVLNPGTQVTAIIVGWTRGDGTQHFLHIQNPAQDPQSSAVLRGLVAEYGSILVRVYQFTFTAPTPASLAAAQALQDAANNPANWTAA